MYYFSTMVQDDSIFKKCRDVFQVGKRSLGIDSVLVLEDVAAPILSSHVEKYGSFAFRGPSFKSVFLTINKYYTRKLLDPNPVPYCHIDLNSRGVARIFQRGGHRGYSPDCHIVLSRHEGPY